MDPKVAKLDNLDQIWTCWTLIRPIIHQRIMLEGSESSKSFHKLVLPEILSINAYYTVILGEMKSKSSNCAKFNKNIVFYTLNWLPTPLKYYFLI